MDAIGADRPPTVAVVVCSHTSQRWPDTLHAIESLRAQSTPPEQIIAVVDHNSPLLKQLRARFPDITVVANSHDKGLSGARNTGVDVAATEIVAFLDDDAVADEHWLERLRDAYSDPSVIGVGGAVEPLWRVAPPAWLPAEFLWVVGCSYLGLPSARAKIRNAIGANMSFRRQVFDAVGGFDPGLGRIGMDAAGCEETELSIRARHAFPGGQVMYEPDAVCHHVVPAARLTRTYFRDRCRAEGRSKAVVSELVGSEDALASERHYIRHVLPRGIVRGLAELMRGERSGGARAAAIIEGALLTFAAYAVTRVRLRARATAGRVRRQCRSASSNAETVPFTPIPIADLDLANGLSVPSSTAKTFVIARIHGVPIAATIIESTPLEDLPKVLQDQLVEHLRRDGLPTSHPLEAAGDIHRSACAFAVPPSTSFATVVVCSLGKDPRLRRAVDSLLTQSHTEFEVIVVDNDPESRRVTEMLADIPDSRLRIVSERRRGLSAARNAGLRSARGDIVAFTDDDAVADPAWLAALVAPFDVSSQVACVTGLVLPDSLATPAQLLFEEFGGFSKGFERTLWAERINDESLLDFGTPGDGGILFPYSCGVFGSGNNMAFRAEFLRKLGGFDIALGAGTVARGGEDLDAFLSVITAGKAIVYEPQALVRHSARADFDGLRRQMFDYGVGMCAVLTKHAIATPISALRIARRVPAGLWRLFSSRSPKNRNKTRSYPRELTRAELAGYAAAPWLYLRSRRAARDG